MCDPGYSGSDCSVPDTPNPDFLKEDFEGTATYRCTQKAGNRQKTVCVWEHVMNNVIYKDLLISQSCQKSE